MSARESITHLCKIQQTIDPISAAAGALDDDYVDCRGYSRACHVLIVGTMGATSSITASVYESAASGGTYTLITSSLTTIANTTGEGEALAIDVPVNKDKPYQVIMATGGTAWTNVGALVLLYAGSGPWPKTQESTATIV